QTHTGYSIRSAYRGANPLRESKNRSRPLQKLKLGRFSSARRFPSAAVERAEHNSKRVCSCSAGRVENTAAGKIPAPHGQRSRNRTYGLCGSRRAPPVSLPAAKNSGCSSTHTPLPCHRIGKAFLNALTSAQRAFVRGKGLVVATRRASGM